MPDWFDDLPVIGKMPPEQAAAKLREVGEDEAADMLEMASEGQAKSFAPGSRKSWWPFQDKPWQYASHAIGYLAPAQPGTALLPIHDVGNISADASLKHARIKITLNRFHVAAYPGGGMHRVLLHFFAQNQVAGKSENLHFNATYRVHEGDHAGVQGYPIFVGLRVGSEGLIFKCRTINVQNDQDEAFLSFLESDVFKAGLKIVNTAQPVVAPFSEMALALARAIGARHRNVSVQDFDLGLDFSAIPLGARLAEGAYVAVQIPQSFQPIWDWNDWVYSPTGSKIVKRSDLQQSIPFNYLVFGISRYEEH